MHSDPLGALAGGCVRVWLWACRVTRNTPKCSTLGADPEQWEQPAWPWCITPL